MFSWAKEAKLIPEMEFGPDFKKPDKKRMRKERHKHAPSLYTAAKIRNLIEAAGPQLRAMIYLGINCGFGNSDCGTLPLRALDLDGGWVDYPRPKTEVRRALPSVG